MLYLNRKPKLNESFFVICLRFFDKNNTIGKWYRWTRWMPLQIFIVFRKVGGLKQWQSSRLPTITKRLKQIVLDISLISLELLITLSPIWNDLQNSSVFAVCYLYVLRFIQLCRVKKCNSRNLGEFLTFTLFTSSLKKNNLQPYHRCSDDYWLHGQTNPKTTQHGTGIQINAETADTRWGMKRPHVKDLNEKIAHVSRKRDLLSKENNTHQKFRKNDALLKNSCGNPDILFLSVKRMLFRTLSLV